MVVQHWRVSGLPISSVAACFTSTNVHSVDFASFQPFRSQHSLSRLVSGLQSCPNIILYYNLCPPFHPPLLIQCKHPWYYLTSPTSHAYTASKQRHLKEWALITHKVHKYNLSICIILVNNYEPGNEVVAFLDNWTILKNSSDANNVQHWQSLKTFK